MTDSQQPERKSSPGLAKLITVVLLALVVYSEVTTHHVEPELLGACVILACFWAGATIDRFLPFR